MVSVGTRLGPYDIVAPLGAGGMGEVWKARDTRLDRSVAVKVLPGRFASDAQLRVRFEREAKTISQLTHPHICTLYDVGSDDGVEYLVMELLEGESLADRIARGPLPIADVLTYGAQIADALDRAHRAGVVHRDLKPGNIMITKSGAKLLDFGLAKPAEINSAVNALTSLRTEQKNTITEEGTIIGTFQYMAPEQVEGADVDARTDIFAFGAVLYEMATGRRTFDGRTKASLIASILTADPQPISAVAPMTPRTLDRLVRKCLEKDPDARWQSAHDLATELRWIAENPDVEVRRPRRRALLPWAAAALLLGTAVVFAAQWYRVSTAPRQRITMEITPPAGMEFLFPFSSPSPSPDGRLIAFQAHTPDGKFQLFVRHLDSGAVTLPGNGVAAFATFWSPDSRSIGFFTAGKLERIDVEGGAAQAICDAPAGRGGTWLPDGTIVFAHDRGPLYRVPAAGGKAVPLTSLGPNEYSHRWPSALPDGKHFVYLAQVFGATERGRIILGSVASNQHEVLAASSGPAQYASGCLLYMQEHALIARPFDPRRLQFTGDAAIVANPVQFYAGTASAAFSVSNHLLTYQGGSSGIVSVLERVDRTGKVIETIGKPADYFQPSLARDGRHLAYNIVDEQGNSDVWIYDLVRHTETRLTFDPGADTNAIWSPDGREIVYHSEQVEKGTHDVVRKAASGVGRAETLFKSDAPFVGVTDWSPDGKYLIFHAASPRSKTSSDIFTFSLADHQVRPVVQTPFAEVTARLSPDGKWLAYASLESGRNEIYVVPFPVPTTRLQISTAGGTQPRWKADGAELYYQSPDGKIMAVPMTRTNGLEAGEPHPLFSFVQKSGGWQYDVTRDGQFILNQPERTGSTQPFTVVLNWDAGLAR